MKRLGLLFLMTYAVSGGVAHAATYYVSKTGSNSNTCAQAQSTSTPKLTINAGIGCLTAGDTLLVRAGNYDEEITSVPSGTSWSSVVRIANYSGETVWLKPLVNGAGNNGRVIWLDGNFHYVEFDGINADGSNLSGTESVVWFSTNNGNNPHHIRYKNAEVIAGAIGSAAAINLGGHTLIGATGSHEIQHVTIHGGGLPGLCGYACASYGVYLAGPDNLVEDTNIYNTSGACIQIYNANGDPAVRNIVRRNYCHDVTRFGDPAQLWGIIVAGGNNQIYNNLVVGINGGNIGDGININSGSGNKIYNNTVYKNAKIGIDVSFGASNTEVTNNIAYANVGSQFVVDGSGTLQSNNLFGVDPLFVNASANNFQLQAVSSAVDKATSLSVVTTDFAGIPRPQGSGPDIGAYEYSAQASTPVAPAPPTNVRIVSN